MRNAPILTPLRSSSSGRTEETGTSVIPGRFCWTKSGSWLYIISMKRTVPVILQAPSWKSPAGPKGTGAGSVVFRIPFEIVKNGLPSCALHLRGIHTFRIEGFHDAGSPVFLVE